MVTKNNFIIHPSEPTDLDYACQLFDDAIAWQKAHGYPTYKSNDRSAVKLAIERGRHFKIVAKDDILAVFNIELSDHSIWQDDEKGDAVYLHRIITNQRHRGLNLFQTILDWAKEKATSEGRNKIRLDTWAGNEKLITYYIKYGFRPVRIITMPDANDVSENCRGGQGILLEYKFR